MIPRHMLKKFLIPTRRQWQRWALPSRLTFAGFVLTAASFLFAFLVWVWPSKSDSLIRKANPTNVRLVAAELANWAGDAEPFLTLTLGNISALDALNPRACVLNLSCDQPITSKGIMEVPAGSSIVIGPQQTMQIPVLSQNEVRKFIEGRVSQPYHMLGWGIEPNLPSEFSNPCAFQAVDNTPCSKTLLSLGLPVQVKWGSVLDLSLIHISEPTRPY